MRTPLGRAGWIAATLLLVAAGWLAARPQRRVAGTWTTIVSEDLVLGVEVTGTLRAVRSEFLGPPPLVDVWEFQISRLVPEGSEVRRGTPVLAFDTADLTRELATRTAESDSARTEIEKTGADLRLQREKDELSLAEAEARSRKASLKLDLPTDLIGAQERRFAEIETDLARREVAHWKAKIAAKTRAAAEELASLEAKRRFAEDRARAIEERIEQMTVRAPRDGVIIYVPDRRGEKKKVGDSAWRADHIVEIPDLSRMMAAGDVDEADSGRVASGQRVRLRLDAHPDDELEGVIMSVGQGLQRPAPRSPLKVLRLLISLDRMGPSQLRPGMRFRGTIEEERIPKAIIAPLAAVRVGAAGPFALRKRLLSEEPVRLQIGRRAGRFVQVLSGLRAGDRVLVASDEGIEPSQP